MRVAVRKAHRLAGALTIAFLAAACGGGGSEEPLPDTATGAPAEAPSALHGSVEDGANNAFGLPLQVPELTAKIVKDATLRVSVAEDAFDARLQRAVTIAGTHGGFVASSKTAGDEHPSGTLVLRIPGSEFEAALGELKGLGEVTDEQISGQDVTGQYVDLQARLRNWRAQEQVLLGLMAEATTIDESLKVQSALQDVQLAIEELEGQVRAIDDQTAMSTITLDLFEGGPAAAPDDPGGIPSVSRAWSLALQGFLAVVSTIVIGLGYATPFVLIGLVAWAIWRWARRRADLEAVPPPPAGATA
jgi:hypothetical protein